MKVINKILIASLLVFLPACSSDDAKDLIDDLEDVDDGPDRKQIDISKMGVNAFGNEPQFGSACEQYSEIKNALKLNFVRLLFNWDNGVQASPGIEPNFSFQDNLINCLPDGIEALIIVNGLPAWMADSANWIENNPRTTFVQLWLRKVVERYRTNSKVKAIQVWNEPNMASDTENQILGFVNTPENYLELLARSYSLIKDLAPNKLVLNAATTSINQNFPETLDYNKALVSQGMLNFIDVFAMHYYGYQIERFVAPDGVRDFLQSLGKSIWVTESGEQGINMQLEYVERIWPYLMEQVSNINRIYYYQYAEGASSETSYGLKSAGGNSDLYAYLTNS